MRIYRPSPSFVMAIVVIAALVTYTAYAFNIAIGKLNQIQPRNPEPVTQVCNTLPCECRPLYNKGGDDWINCMGVGYVSYREGI